MKKLSLSLLTSLIALGLLFVWNANAMTYTVNWDSTTIAIPRWINNTTIKRCEEEGCETTQITKDSDDCDDNKCCERRINNTYYTECRHKYDNEWTYTVYFDGKNNEFANLYLDAANIQDIIDYSNILQITNLYLWSNTEINLWNDTFSDSPVTNLYLDHNNISTYNTSIPSQFNILSLESNELTTIPDVVWNARDNYRIKLASNKSYNPHNIYNKYIDLSNNQIKFIKITEINGEERSSYYFDNPTQYQFWRFWYSHETDNLNFNYTILNQDNDPVIEERETTNSSITITDPLKPWTYKFKVSLDNDTYDTGEFYVYYQESITFTEISTSPINDIHFSWQRSWNYPASLISWYYYTLSRSWSIIDSWRAADGTASYSLDTALIEDNPNWNYVFTVYLIDTEWNRVSLEDTAWNITNSATTSFDIAISSTITINFPKSTEYWSWSDEVNVHFNWDTSSPLFGHYKYYITDNDTCSESANTLTWGESNIENTEFNYSLWIWDYLLCIDMYKPSGNKVNDASVNHHFRVEIPANIRIISPSWNSTITEQPIQITWDSFIPAPYTFTDYTYTVLKWTEEYKSNTVTTPSLQLNNLPDDTYTVNVTVNYSDGAETATTRFTVNSSAEANLNLIPNNWQIFTWNYIKQVPVTFSWEWGWSPLIHSYYYKITSASNVIDSGTKLASDNLTLGEKLLQSGTYRFEVTMLDSDGHQIKNPYYSDFTVVIPSDLRILSPSEWLQTTKDITFSRTWFAESDYHYSYQLNKIWNETPIKTDDDTDQTSFSMLNMVNGQYTLTVSLLDNSDNVIETRTRTFSIPDSQELTLNISDWEHSVTTLNSRTWIFSWWGTSENFDSYSYSVEWITYKNENYSYNWTTGLEAWSFTLTNLATWRYRFTVTMLDASNNPITWKYIDFNVAIPATLKITSLTNWSNITTSSATFTWTWYSDIITEYHYQITGSPIYSTTGTSVTINNLTNGNYTFTVKLYSWENSVAEDSIDFTVNIPVKPSWGGWGGWSSWKTHYTNNLKLSLWNESPAANEWIKLIVKINDSYVWKVTFPKLQHYSSDTQKWEDIPVTSKNYVADYSDDAKLWYIKFSSDDDWRKDLSQFIKFSKNGYYRIYAEDKDWYDTYVEFKVSGKSTQTTTNTSGKDTTTVSNTNKTSTIDNIIQQYIPDVYQTQDTSEEVYISRSCKRYTIQYSDSLNVYTSPNLNKNEYFVNKDYFKRYVDSKNKYQQWCPTNIGWISTNYTDKTNDNTRYTAPNGKVYFITWGEWNYYSNELNKELKTPTSFRTIQELKYYIRDRNPLISMAALWPTN